jgi:hypothetical protein
MYKLLSASSAQQERLAVGTYGEQMNRRQREHRKAEVVHSLPGPLGQLLAQQRRDLDREQPVHGDDAPRDCDRVIVRGERDQDVYRSELYETVQHDGGDVDHCEHDR